MEEPWTKNLQDLAARVVGVAPMLGTIIGGPIGGAAGTAVKMIASALGLEIPDHVDPVLAIKNRLNADPQALLTIRTLELNNQHELQKLMIGLETVKIQEETKRITEETNQLLSVNATMQSEGKSEHWVQYSWRPFWGFSSGAAFLFVCVLVCLLAWRAIVEKDATAMSQIPLIIGAFATLFAIPGAILGITAWKRGQMQVETARPLPGVAT